MTQYTLRLKWLIILLPFLFFSCAKPETISPAPSTPTTPSVVTPAPLFTSKVTPFTIDFPGIDLGQFGMTQLAIECVSQTILYATKDGMEHLISNPYYLAPAPVIHFILKNGTWVLEGKYPEAAMDGFRNYDPLDSDGSFVIANHGSEALNPRPFGDIFVVKTSGEKLKWTKVSEGKSFYHSAAGGDLDGDGLFDISGIHMGTYTNWGEGPHLYKQNTNATFNTTRGLLDTTGFKGRNLGLGATLITDILGDSRNELIIAEYGFNTTFNKNFNERFGVAFFDYDKASGKLKYVTSLKELGIYSNPDRGTTSIKVADIDKDGDKDLLIAAEGSDSINLVQIFTNDGKGNFTPGQIISFNFNEFQFREFELVDINQDGYSDILFHSFHIRIDQTIPNAGINLQNNVWINNKGTFAKYPKEIAVPSVRPGFIKGFFVNGKVKFVGFGDPPSRNTPFSNTFDFYEITLNLF
jgi:hypothetical protein